MNHMEDMQIYKMFFHLKTDTDFLLENIKISSTQGLILAMVFTFVITICYDTIKYMVHLRDFPKIQSKKRNLQILRLFVKTVLHMMSVCLANVMMLSIMTMNVLILLTVIIGSGLAHLVMKHLLSWEPKEAKLSMELDIESPKEDTEKLSESNNKLKQETAL